MTQKDVLDFWFTESTPDQWFARNEKYDNAIRDRFGKLHEKAMRGELDDWATNAHGALALVIILDQFSRNLYRDSAKAFANDAKALAIAKAAIENELDCELETADMRKFLYMPYMHSEDLAVQDLGLALFESLNDPETMQYARQHREEIAAYGRFRGRHRA